MLFAADIHANICFGTPGATEEEVREAAHAANAATFIERLPEGYHTQVCCLSVMTDAWNASIQIAD